MSEPSAPVPPDEAPPEAFAVRLGIAQRAGGAIVPVLTVLVAFLMGGVVVAATEIGRASCRERVYSNV